MMSVTALERLAELIRFHAPDTGLMQTQMSHVLVGHETESNGRVPWVYEPALIISANGRKNVYLDGARYHYSAGHFMALFMPMAVEYELIDVSVDNPMLGVAIRLDRQRLANLVLKMDVAEPVEKQEISGIFSAPIKENMLEAVIRLLETLKDPVATAVLGSGIIDEIYFRLLTEEQGGSLRLLLQQQGQIQKISKAVEHLHENLNQNITVDELANLANMSVSGFHKKFKDTMHVSPLQYTKLIRLNKARTLILEGKNISEAGFAVGYNSPAQFSREFRRQFGLAPSEARVV